MCIATQAVFNLSVTIQRASDVSSFGALTARAVMHRVGFRCCPFEVGTKGRSSAREMPHVPRQRLLFLLCWPLRRSCSRVWVHRAPSQRRYLRVDRAECARSMTAGDTRCARSCPECAPAALTQSAAASSFEGMEMSGAPLRSALFGNEKGKQDGACAQQARPAARRGTFSQLEEGN